jgi:hypothetical protein
MIATAKFRGDEEIYIKLKRKNQTLFVETNCIEQLTAVQAKVAAMVSKAPQDVRLFLNMTPAERVETLKVIDYLLVYLLTVLRSSRK